MKALRILILPLLLLYLTTRLCAAVEPSGASTNLASVRQKQAIKVLVTDSGLGGLSVCGDLERKALARRSFRSVEIVFCNALPEPNYGYNDLKTPQRKAQVFSAALNGMVKWYDPDVVLIACNTLSVVYSDTEISRTLKVPVVGIVDLGVDMIVVRMKRDSAAPAIVFGTETTIATDSHKTKCISRGIAGSRIITQACGELAGEIQSAPRGDATRNLIELYVNEAVTHLPGTSGKVIVALCCTHYGFCSDVFSQAFAAAGRNDIEIVNPNDKMADVLFAPAAENKFPASDVTVKVVSRAFLSPEEIRGISGLLEKESPKTADALRKYERKADLFPFPKS
jgi:glutamate racemase